MYSEWASLNPKVETVGNESILSKFSNAISKDVVSQVGRQLFTATSTQSMMEAPPVRTHQEVMWCMEVLNQGLSSPSSDQDPVKDCVHVYCDWLTALLPIPKAGIPDIITKDPYRYAPLILNGLYKVFVPRRDLAPAKQAVFCHRVLRTIQTVAQESNELASSMWHAILMFLLADCDALLSPPSQMDDLGGQMCERLLSALFEVWLLACAKSFPTPPQWKTLNELCQKWRHRPELIDIWYKCMMALTKKLLSNLYGPDFPIPLSANDSGDGQIVITSLMKEDNLVQSWYRLFHCIGNPCDLVKPTVIAQTQTFLQYALLSQQVVEPSQHPCLAALPAIFLKAIRTVAAVGDAFLGLKTSGVDPKRHVSWALLPQSKEPTPILPPRRPTKSFSGMPSPSFHSSRIAPSSPLLNSSSSTASGQSTLTSLESEMGSLMSEFRPTVALGSPHSLRPKCATLLHLVGEWLFEASLVGCPIYSSAQKYGSSGSVRRPGSSVGPDRRVLMQTMSTSESDTPASPPGLIVEKFDLGRAEALGALCRILCSKKTGDEIPSVYLARFYIAVQQALRVTESRHLTEVMSCFLLNVVDLFRLDLDGVNILVPPVIDTLELVLLPYSPSARSFGASNAEIRRSCIQILVSLLPLPLHFQGLAVRDLAPTLQNRSFGQFWKKLLALLFSAIQTEAEFGNIQLLLGAVFSAAVDLSALEQRGTPAFSVGAFAADSDSYSNHSLSTTDYSIPEEPSDLGDSPLSSIQTNASSYDIGSSLTLNAASAICQRLVTAWRNDLSVIVSALETLDGLARLPVQKRGSAEAQKVVKWLCELIVYQCSKPPPAHSKDLHSAIVAAFQCLTTWLSQSLLFETECMSLVLEVVELGISGSRSFGRGGSTPVLKHEKDCKPVSLRVRDAAEALLANMVEQIGYFPSVLGASHLSSLLNEESLASRCGSSVSPNDFRYFAMENGTILSLLEEPLGNYQDPQPTVSVVLRNHRGRHVWTMHHRQLSRHSSALRGPPPNPGLPLPLTTNTTPLRTVPSCFPEICERAPQFLVDKSIPSVDQVVEDLPQFSQLSRLVEQQALSEKYETERRLSEFKERKECEPPPPGAEFQAARLILSHLGLVSQKETSVTRPDDIIPLDAEDLYSDLQSLDSLPARNTDTVYALYVRVGQTTAQEILSNLNSPEYANQQFLEFVQSLGWNTSRADSAQNGTEESASYFWADACSELKFVLPNDSYHEQTESSIDSSTSVRSANSGSPLDTLTLIVWLECFEDSYTFPTGALLRRLYPCSSISDMSQNAIVIFVHPLRSGLLRIRLVGPVSKWAVAPPLVEGHILSKRSAGAVIRQAALHIGRKRKLHSDSFQSSLARRKQKLQEIISKHRTPLIHTSLFRSPNYKSEVVMV